MDKIVKIWNVNEEQQAEGGKREISLVTSRDLGVVSGPRVSGMPRLSVDRG
jgi:hypothetical protein